MIYVCKDCDSPGVQVKEWVELNSGKKCGSVGDENLSDPDNNYCPKCEVGTVIIVKEDE